MPGHLTLMYNVKSLFISYEILQKCSAKVVFLFIYFPLKPSTVVYKATIYKTTMVACIVFFIFGILALESPKVEHMNACNYLQIPVFFVDGQFFFQMFTVRKQQEESQEW